jgi:hypothetical protein
MTILCQKRAKATDRYPNSNGHCQLAASHRAGGRGHLLIDESPVALVVTSSEILVTDIGTSCSEGLVRRPPR